MTWEILSEFTDRRTFVVVRCGCGVVQTRRKDHVLQGKTKYCKKCSASNTLKDYPHKKFGPRPHSGIGDISRTLWTAYKFGAKRRDIPFEVSIQDGWDQFVLQDGKCALSGIPITLKHGYKGCNVDWKGFTASLDRKDSDKPYIKDNIQWVHEIVNYIKRDLDEPEFIEWCKRIAENNGGECGA